MAFLHEPGNGFGPPFHMQLIEDVCQVVFNRLVAQAELGWRSPYVRLPLCQQRQNETLLRGQSSDALCIHSQVRAGANPMKRPLGHSWI
jgi:hypothetical protein